MFQIRCYSQCQCTCCSQSSVTADFTLIADIAARAPDFTIALGDLLVHVSAPEDACSHSKRQGSMSDIPAKTEGLICTGLLGQATPKAAVTVSEALVRGHTAG